MQAFLTKNSINCKGTLISLEKPLVMGILNLTPDSFYLHSRVGSDLDLLKKAEAMLAAGASFLDIGGQSTRPGAEKIDSEEELRRVLPAIQSIIKEFPGAFLSIDTFYAQVAKEAVLAGACLVNDVSAGEEDEQLFSVVAELQVPYVLMHRKGNFKTMQVKPMYDNIALEIAGFFAEKIYQLNALGVADIILDPGFGFGKTMEHNYELLASLDSFKVFEYPLLVGISRKNMIQKVINKPATEALFGTLSAHVIALMKGAKILRVHDVPETMDMIRVFDAFENERTRNLN